MHPLYDLKTKTWVGYHNGNCYEAKTLAIIAKLIPEVVIEGYHPNGYGMVRHASTLDGDPRASQRRSPFKDRRQAPRKLAHAFYEQAATGVAPDVKTSPLPPDAPLRLKYSEQENRALDLWLEGFSAVEIGARVARKTTWVASWVVTKARLLNDPRAVIRYPKLIGPRGASKTRSDSDHPPAE